MFCLSQEQGISEARTDEMIGMFEGICPWDRNGSLSIKAGVPLWGNQHGEALWRGLWVGRDSKQECAEEPGMDPTGEWLSLSVAEA